MTIEAGKIYNFKTEFWSTVGINKRQWEERKEELLIWLENFYDYELYDGRPIKIFIKEVYGEYRPLPRKGMELMKQKQSDYETFAIASLSTEFKPNSKAKTSRDAIDAFGYEKYGHTNTRAVAARYVGPVFDKYGETNGIKHWVWYSTYEPLNQEAVERWRQIMFEEHISEAEAANAFYRQEQGEDISKEQGYFKRARQRLKEEYGQIAILVSDWRVKK